MVIRRIKHDELYVRLNATLLSKDLHFIMVNELA